MNDRPDERQPVPPGLCASCRHERTIVSAKGSHFVQCDRSRTDARYPRYPRLPVIACPGHDPKLVE